MDKQNLLSYLITNGGKPNNESWLDLAKRFEVGEGLSNEQRSKKVNDIWRTYIKKENKDLEDFSNSAKIKTLKKWQDYTGNWRQSISYEEQEKKFNPDKFKKNLVSALTEYEFPKFTSKYPDFNQVAACINIFDAHIEKITLKIETGLGSTIEDNVRIFENSFNQLLTTAKAFSPEVIIFPISGDFFNTNDSRGTTKKGTPQDNSVKHHDAFRVGLNLLRKCIDTASQVAPVVVPIIRGNHDEDAIYYLSTILETIYADNNNVRIDGSRISRKYVEYGQNLIGFAHGDLEKPEHLPLIMAEEQKEAWARTKFRQWFLGDKHHTQDFVFRRSKDFIGANVTYMRSLTPTDNWHHQNGFIGTPKSADLYIFDYIEGKKANFTVNI